MLGKSVCLRATLALAFCSATTNAQAGVELIPFAGSYVPLMNFGEARNQSPIGESHSTFWQTQGVLLGLRGRFPFNSQTGVELGIRYATTGWREDYEVVSGPGLDVGYSLSGSLTVVDARFTYRPTRSNFYALAGAALMNRGGRAWSDILPGVEYTKSNPSGLVGLGIRASGSARFQIDATIELLVYSVKKVGSNTLVNGPFVANELQSDLLFTVGLPISLGQRR